MKQLPPCVYGTTSIYTSNPWTLSTNEKRVYRTILDMLSGSEEYTYRTILMKLEDISGLHEGKTEWTLRKMLTDPDYNPWDR